jgi:hypothetical protein
MSDEEDVFQVTTGEEREELGRRTLKKCLFWSQK